MVRIRTISEPDSSGDSAASDEDGGSSDASSVERPDQDGLGDGSKARARERIDRERRQMAEIEARDPLRGRILRELGAGPATPSVLARALEAAPESISRQLRALREGGLAEEKKVFGDRRRRSYALTGDGAIELNRHRAFGALPAPPPLPTQEQARAYLRSALERAVEVRRKTNDLADAAVRLRMVFEQAERQGANELAVDALSELATTLRQNRQASEASELIGKLDGIALGQDPRYEPSVVLLAGAHRDYALGRVAEGHGSDRLSVRAMNLVNAAISYHRLSKVPLHGAAERSKERQAWSIASFASNLREQSELGAALDHAGLAMGLFEQLKDMYGRSYCLFLLGFCWRLQGDFQEAWQRLRQARELACEGGFKRFEADTTMQLGEVRRCQGELTEARSLLEEALGLADQMELVVTSAFARSALGAVEYQERRLQPACEAIDRAQDLFEVRKHQAGLALNTFRKAVLTRTLLAEQGHRRRRYQALERLLADATERYKDLGSPAGVAACEIECARLTLMRNGKAPRQIDQLIALLDKEGGRGDVLPLDPWLPRALASFAKEAKSDELEQRAQRLLEEGRRRRLEERAHQSTWRATPSDRVLDVSEESGAFAMGGETRLEEPLRVPIFDLTAAFA